MTVSAAHDADAVDDTASITHAATSSDGDYGGISVSAVRVTVTDDEDVPVTVSFAQAAYTVAEGDDLTVTVKLSADPERTVEIPLLKVNQGGATSADYSGVPASVTFTSGDTSATFTFSAESDSADDDGESVRLTFGTLPNAVSAGNPAATTVSITDDDDPAVTVSFAQATYTVAESDDTSTTNVTENQVVVTVELSADPERTVEIPLTTTHQGGASSGDYSGVPAEVTFASGETEQTFTFAAAHDTADDDGESVKLGFGGSLPARVSAGATHEAVVRITDDDDPAVTVSFGQANYSVAEGDDVAVTVELSADPERTVEIPLTVTNMGGASNGDYSGVPARVTFASGDTSKNVHVQRGVGQRER